MFLGQKERRKDKNIGIFPQCLFSIVSLNASSLQDRKVFDMFTGSDGGAGGDWGPERPTRGKKIPFEFTFKHFVIFMVLFILMLVILYIVETAAKTQAQPDPHQPTHAPVIQMASPPPEEAGGGGARARGERF